MIGHTPYLFQLVATHRRRSYSDSCWPTSWHWHLWDMHELLWCNSRRQRDPCYFLQEFVRSACSTQSFEWHTASISASIPATKESIRLLRIDSKRPDRFMLVPWWENRCFVCDVTLADSTALSYLQSNIVSASRAAEAAATLKSITIKYS